MSLFNTRMRAGVGFSSVTRLENSKANLRSAIVKISREWERLSGSARRRGKTGRVLELLQRPGGATLKQLTAATQWRAHSVRGFLSGALKKKMGLKIVSTKGASGVRSYSIQA